MITKDSDYLNNKLRQLKTQVLSKQQIDVPTISNPSQQIYSQKYISTVDQKGSAFIDSKPQVKFYTPSQTDNIHSYQPTTLKQTFDVPNYANPQLSSTIGPSVFIDAKRPLSNQVIDGLRANEISFGGNRQQYANNGVSVVLNDGKSSFANMEPKVRTVHASNSKSFVNQEPTYDFIKTDQSFGMSYIKPDFQVNQQSTYRPGPQVIKQSEYAPVRVNSVNPSNLDRSYVQQPIPDAEFLKNLKDSSFPEKYEGKLASELQQKLSTQMEKNNRLGDEIMNLRRAAEQEKQRLVQMDEQYKEEYKHAKITEADTLNAINNLDQHHNEIHQTLSTEDQKNGHMKGNYDKIQAENEMLRGELKKLGEMTSEKILDLENNINSVARIKDLEVESFSMEKEKLANTAEFVIEQMKVHYNDRSSKIEEQLRKLGMERDKLASDLKAVTDEIKMYNVNADQKINTVMNNVIQEEQEKHQIEVRDIEAKIRFEEDEIGKINRKNQELINKFHIMERDGKNRLMSKKNENTRLKEDFNNFEQNLNKMILQLVNLNKEYDKKKEMLDMMKDDHDDFQNKSQMADQRVQDEIHNIHDGHEEQIRELDREYLMARDREQKLLQAIRDENDRLFDSQKKHAEIIDEIQTGFNQTLQNQFSRVTK